MNEIVKLIVAALEADRRAVAEQAAELAFEKVGNGKKYGAILSVAEAAEVSKLKVQTIYQKSSRGELPGARKVGSRLVFDTAEFMQWVNGGRL